MALCPMQIILYLVLMSLSATASFLFLAGLGQAVFDWRKNDELKSILFGLFYISAKLSQI